MTRLEKLDSLKSHHWYKNVMAKFNDWDMVSIKLFIQSYDALDEGDFAKKIDLMFEQLPEKPKRWKDMTEVLHVSNKLVT